MDKYFKQLLVSFDPSLKTTRKAVILLITISFLVGVFIFLFQRLVSPFKRIRISKINTLRIGHMLLEIDWYLSVELVPIRKSHSAKKNVFNRSDLNSTFV